MRRTAILIVVASLSALGASPAGAQVPDVSLPDVPVPELPDVDPPRYLAMTEAEGAAVQFLRSTRRVLGAAAAQARAAAPAAPSWAAAPAAAARVAAAARAAAARAAARVAARVAGLDRILVPARHPQPGTRSTGTTTSAPSRTAQLVQQVAMPRPVSRRRTRAARRAAAQTAQSEESSEREPSAGTSRSHRLPMEVFSAALTRRLACL